MILLIELVYASILHHLLCKMREWSVRTECPDVRGYFCVSLLAFGLCRESNADDVVGLADKADLAGIDAQNGLDCHVQDLTVSHGSDITRRLCEPWATDE